MKDTIMQYLNDYIPVLLMLVMMFIDKFGFGNLFSAFRKDITASFDTKNLVSTIEDIKGELRSVTEELKEVKEEIKREREILERVKGGRK